MADDAPQIPESYERANALVSKLLKDGKLGPDVRKLAKETFPDAGLEFPEDRFDAQLSPLRDELEQTGKQLQEALDRQTEGEKAADEASQVASMQAKLDDAVRKYSLTADGAQKMVDRMKETGNASDFEAAAAWVAGQMPKPVDNAGLYLGPQHINLFGSAEQDERFSLLHRDPMGKFLDAEFREFVADPDAYVRSAGFAA